MLDLVNQNMKAVRIKYHSKDNIVAVPSENGVLTVIISSKGYETPRFDVGGYIPETNTHVDWIKSTLEVGSTVIIEILEVSDSHELAKPIKVRKNGADLVNQEKVKYYHRLKKELEEKGLI